MNEIIKTINLSKFYGNVHAVDNISINVQKGEIYGFLGLNGAGKTTVIRMLLGMISPTSGQSYLKGKKVDAGAYDLWKDVGYLVETPYSYPELTVKENLEIMRRLHHINEADCINRVVDNLKLNEYTDRKVKNLSLGNAQRLGIAKALLHHPKILILDEPSNGLDPEGIAQVREILLELAYNQGVTIFISSHILSEIARIANRIGIIHDGKLIEELDSTHLEKLCQKHLLLDSKDNKQLQSILTNAGYQTILFDDGIIKAGDVKAIHNPDEIAKILVHANCPPTLLKVETEDLESYFLRMIGKTGGRK